MSRSKTETKVQKKAITFKKEVTFNIREDIISKQFILRSIKSFVEKNDKFEEEITVKSPLGDSMVKKIKKGDKKIIISTKHENDIELSIKGDPELIKKFLHDITLEAVSRVASEFTGSVIKSMKPNFSLDKFHSILDRHLHQALHLSIEEVLNEKME